MKKIHIEKIKYFGEETKSDDWNAKVLYKFSGRLRHALIYIDFFNRQIFIPSKQPPECKVHPRLMAAISNLNYFNI